MSVSHFAAFAGICALAFSLLSFLAPDGKMKNACGRIMTLAVFASIITIIPAVTAGSCGISGGVNNDVGYDSEVFEKVENIRKEYAEERVEKIVSSCGLEAKKCSVVYENYAVKKIIIFFDEKVIEDESEHIHISEVREKTADAFGIEVENVIAETYETVSRDGKRR